MNPLMTKSEVLDGLVKCFRGCFDIVTKLNENPKAILELKLDSTYIDQLLMTTDSLLKKLKENK